ncbi:MAG: response regulator [Candidatus Dadabacteria bacterium]|nr:MAG: response regulator [Candidatus Dadabacteria bacterium]
METSEYRQRFDEELRRIARDSFRLITGAAIVIFILLIPVNLHLAIAPWRIPAVAITATLVLIFLATLLLDLWRPLQPAVTVHLLAGFACLLAVSNMVALLAWQRPEASGFELLLLLALAYFMLPTIWFTGIVALVFATFELAVWLIGGGSGWMLSRMLLIIAVFVSYVIRIGRFQNISKLLDAQLALGERTRQLQRLLRQERRDRTRSGNVQDHGDAPVIDQDAIDELETEVRLREELLSRLNRDTATPLTAILGFSDLLLHRTTQPDVRQFATWIRRAAHRLQSGVTNALDLTRLEAGELEATLAVCELKPLLSNIAARWGIVAEDRGIELRTFLEPCSVTTDQDRLERILDQLVEDAIRATGDGWVALSAARTDDTHAVIEIRDTGNRSAMSPAFRKESDMTLQIAQRVARQIAGDVDIAEDASGRIVRITLPLTATTATTTQARFPQDDELRVLIVDDDPQCLRLVSEVLGEIASIHTATTPDEAVDLVTQHRFDLALLDINLKHPSIDGTELLQRLRRLPGWQDVPVLALTAYALKQDRENFLDMGFDGYVAKPFSPQTLADQVARFLPRS